MPGQDTQRNLLHHSSLGIEFTVIFGAFLTVGLLVDRWLVTTPGFTMLGATIGFAAALRRLLTQVRRLRRRRERSLAEGPDTDGEGSDGGEQAS